MKSFKKLFCVILSAVLCVQFTCIGFGTADGAGYEIVNPYAEVIWSGDNAWGAYKGSLHTHSTYSDADETLPVTVKEAYAQDYDFLAISDHGITGVDWDKEPDTQILYTYQLFIDNPYEHLTTEEYEAIKNGTYNGRGKKMVPVLGANEFNNLSLSKNHVNGFFLPSDKGNGFMGAENEQGMIQAVKYIDENNGLSHINHPGDWLETNSNPDAVNDPEAIKFFGDLILEYDSCLGIEVFNERNGTTGYDRVLWDNLLMYTLPYGRNVIGFSNTDSHNVSTVDSSFSIFMMEENNVENIKETMQSGAFFGITRKLRKNAVTGSDIGPDEDFDVINAGYAYPMFTNISVEGHSVTVSTKDSTTLQWIANGKVIKTADVSNGGAVTLNLDEISGAEDFEYIRAELLGEGGMCITQAFVIDDGSEPLKFEKETGINALINSIITFFKGTKLWTIIIEISRKV